MQQLLIDPIHTSHPIRETLAEQAYCRVPASAFEMSSELNSARDALFATYPELPPDNHLPDGGAYRFRRYDSFQYEPWSGEMRLLPHETYFQDTNINEVTGGIVRDFAPLTDEIANNPFLRALVHFDFEQFPLDDADHHTPWRVDVHLIRVVATPGKVGHPTPERIHRDGAQYVTVHLAELDNITGGEVSVYDDDRAHLASFTLQNVMDSYLFRDEVLWHGVTPIQSQDDTDGVRSILTFDYHRIATHRDSL